MPSQRACVLYKGSVFVCALFYIAMRPATVIVKYILYIYI